MSAKKVVLKRLKSSVEDSNTPNLLTLVWKKDSNNVIKFHFPMELAYLPNEMAAKEQLKMLRTISSVIGEPPENIEIESEFRASENRPKVIDYLLNDSNRSRIKQRLDNSKLTPIIEDNVFLGGPLSRLRSEVLNFLWSLIPFKYRYPIKPSFLSKLSNILYNLSTYKWQKTYSTRLHFAVKCYSKEVEEVANRLVEDVMKTFNSKEIKCNTGVFRFDLDPDGDYEDKSIVFMYVYPSYEGKVKENIFRQLGCSKNKKGPVVIERSQRENFLKYVDFISAITDQEDKEGLDLTRNPHLSIQEINLGSFNDKGLEANKLGVEFIIQKMSRCFFAEEYE